MSFNYVIIWLLAGLIAGYGYFKYASKTHIGREKKAYRIGLVVAAAIYIFFAVLWGDIYWIVLEILGVLGFGMLALLGKRISYYVVSMGWLLHILWDVALHLQGPGAHVAPAWYAISCASFDLLLAGIIAYRVYSWQKSKINV
ncbi:MAG: hypothetical protein IIB95_12310 [Candidatus Marinimicrobia bacterium]|nr:hypothetical protein [Candidatus Neomarinimicrobiota bacterium]